MLQAYNAGDAARYQGFTSDSILNNPPIFESLLNCVSLKTMRNLSEMNAYFTREVSMYLREAANPKLAREIFDLVCPEYGSERDQEISDHLDDGPDLDIRHTVNKRLVRFDERSHQLKFISYIHRCFMTIITMVHDLSGLKSLDLIKSEGNRFGIAMRKITKELDDLLKPTCTSILDAITHIDDRMVWIGLFGQRALVPFDEFFDKFVAAPMIQRSQVLTTKRYWRALIDFPFTGFVTPYAFNDMIRRFGPVTDLFYNVGQLMVHGCYMGYRNNLAVVKLMSEHAGSYMAWDDQRELIPKDKWDTVTKEKAKDGVKVTAGYIDKTTGKSETIMYETNSHAEPQQSLRNVIAALEAAGFKPLLTNFSMRHVPMMTFADYADDPVDTSFRS